MDIHESDTRSQRIPRNVIALGVVSLLTDVSSEMIYPLVPLFITMLGSGPLILGVIEGMAETTAAMLKLVSGIISDRMGKRKLPVVLGYAVSSLVRPLTGAVSAAGQIVAVRVMDRVGKGIRTAPRDALIASSVDQAGRGRAYGFHRAMDHAGAVLGPLMALAVLILLARVFRVRESLTMLRWTFYAALIPGLLALAALMLFVREKGHTPVKNERLMVSLRQFDTRFTRYLGIVFLFTLGNSSDAFMLFRVQAALRDSGFIYSAVESVPFLGKMIAGLGDLEVHKRIIDLLILPMFWAYFHAIKVMFSTYFGALSDRMGRKKLIQTGWALYALVYTAFALLDRVPDSFRLLITLILFAVYALYYALCEGAEKAFVADVVDARQRGSAFGLFNFAVGLGALPASIIFGFLYQQYGGGTAFGTGAALAALSLLLLAVLVREPRGEDRV